MTMWVQELTMMRLDILPQEWHTAVMEQGSSTFLRFLILTVNLILWNLSNWTTCNRLFSCGTNKEGESFLVEWNESEGSIKRTYLGLGQRAAGIVQFDTTRNRFLAAGDESTIKIWDMDNTNPLTTIHADGGLPVILLKWLLPLCYFHYFSL